MHRLTFGGSNKLACLTEFCSEDTSASSMLAVAMWQEPLPLTAVKLSITPGLQYFRMHLKAAQTPHAAHHSDVLCGYSRQMP